MTDSEIGILSKVAMKGLSKDENGAWTFTKEGLENLRKAFAEVVGQGSEVAIPHIRDLANFAIFMEKKKGAKEPAAQILAVINNLEQVVAECGLKLIRVKPEKDRREKAADFLGGLGRVKRPGSPAKDDVDKEDSGGETFKPWSFRNK